MRERGSRRAGRRSACRAGTTAPPWRSSSSSPGTSWPSSPRPSGPLTPDRLARFVAAHDLPALVAACEDSPSAPVCHGAHQRRRLIRAGQAQVYQRVMPDLPVAVADPFFRLDLTKAAARAGLDLCAPG